MPNVILGPNTEVYTSGREYLWSRVEGGFFRKTVILDSSSRDQGYTHRKGLALGKITSTGTYKTYNSGNSDGSQTFRGILDEEADLLDQYGNPQNYYAAMCVWGRVKLANTFGVDNNAQTNASTGINSCFFIWD